MIGLILLALANPSTTTATASRCEACHVSTSWSEVTFDHDRTRFPLTGEHSGPRCAACHRQGVDSPLSLACASCHLDVHVSALGKRCEGCHDTRTWRSLFDPTAHRRTGFELTGSHAATPCESCHTDALGSRAFSRAGAECVSCHLAEYQRAGTTSIDHAAAGFDDRCARCHLATRFDDAAYPDHDTCFLITAGPHGGIKCRDCHTSIPAGRLEVGACQTNTASCIGCHEHSCEKSDRRHGDVPGYQCKDRKCYECHRFTSD
ncbi:MAG: cytochrome C [Deltaproteobacteria bacterium]|nr:cytochrome C [Deltaproteobacteria bacterium]